MSRCTVPPRGWACSREAGHEGPCAAWAAEPGSVAEEVIDRLHQAAENLGRGYDQVIKTLEQRDRQLDNQAETIDQLRATVNTYASRINELCEQSDRMVATLAEARKVIQRLCPCDKAGCSCAVFDLNTGSS